METWFLFALGAAGFAALMTIFAKIGLAKVDSNLVTAWRTMVVLVFAWAIAVLSGALAGIGQVSQRTWLFLVLSGLSTGGAWLCYYRALQLGSVRKTVPIKKNSTILTILLAFLFLSEPMDLVGIIAIIFIAGGTILMLKPGGAQGEKTERRGFFAFAILSAIFASMTAILGYIGIQDIDVNLGVAIRTAAVVPMSWLMVALTRRRERPVCAKEINAKDWLFILLSGLATGISWLLFYRALQLGPASLVVPVDRLSVLLTMLFARLILNERFTRRSLIGLAVLTIGILLPVVV